MMADPATQPEGENTPPNDYAEQDTVVRQLCEQAAAKLAEHCDSVRIIVTINRGDGFYGHYTKGEGNYYAQRDSVREWLMHQDQCSKNGADAE